MTNGTQIWSQTIVFNMRKATFMITNKAVDAYEYFPFCEAPEIDSDTLLLVTRGMQCLCAQTTQNGLLNNLLLQGPEEQEFFIKL